MDPLDQDDLDRVVVDELVQVLSLVLLRHYQDLLFRVVVQFFVIVHLVGLKPIMPLVQHRHLPDLEQEEYSENSDAREAAAETAQAARNAAQDITALSTN